YAGLIALQKDYGFVGVKMEDNRKSIVMVANKDENPVELASIPVDQDTVYLRIDCDYIPSMEASEMIRPIFTTASMAVHGQRSVNHWKCITPCLILWGTVLVCSILQPKRPEAMSISTISG